MIARIALFVLVFAAFAAAQNVPISGSGGLWVVDAEPREPDTIDEYGRDSG